MSRTPMLGPGSRGPVWLLSVGVPQSLKGFLQHLGPNRDQILTSENPQLRRTPKHRTRTEAAVAPPAPQGLPWSWDWPGWQHEDGPLWSQPREAPQRP